MQTNVTVWGLMVTVGCNIQGNRMELWSWTLSVEVGAEREFQAETGVSRGLEAGMRLGPLD